MNTYCVMHSDRNIIGGDVVLDNVNMVFWKGVKAAFYVDKIYENQSTNSKIFKILLSSTECIVKYRMYCQEQNSVESENGSGNSEF